MNTPACPPPRDARARALDDWGAAVRYCLVVLAERIPAAAAAALWLTARR